MISKFIIQLNQKRIAIMFGFSLTYIISHRFIMLNYYILIRVRDLGIKINLGNSNEIQVCGINSTKYTQFNILGIQKGNQRNGEQYIWHMRALLNRCYSFLASRYIITRKRRLIFCSVLGNLKSYRAIQTIFSRDMAYIERTICANFYFDVFI